MKQVYPSADGNALALLLEALGQTTDPFAHLLIGVNCPLSWCFLRSHANGGFRVSAGRVESGRLRGGTTM